ncbi:MAG TPA: FecR domain-containing protein, partial [Candidatus Acidoferrales bacterium]|nr:FecR domain-containing protein [Candidatus Acidoferrales bacterium]
MRNRFGPIALCAALAFAALATASAGAEAAPRVTVVQGGVEVQQPSGAQSPAIANAPLPLGAYVTTSPNARAEVEFDAAAMLRLAGGVQARFDNEAGGRHVELAAGTVEIAILGNGAGTVEVDTPSVTVRAKAPGAYRVTVAPNGATYVTSRRGTSEIVTPTRRIALDPGKTMVATGAAANPQISYISEVGYDAFDQFNDDRDAAVAQSAEQQSSSVASGGDDVWTYGPSVV